MNSCNAVLKKKIKQKKICALRLLDEALPLWKDLMRMKQEIKQYEMEQEEAEIRVKRQQKEVLQLQNMILDVSLFDPTNQTQSIEFLTDELVIDEDLVLTGDLRETHNKLREFQVKNTTKAIIKATEDTKKKEEIVRAKAVELRECINHKQNLKSEAKQMQSTKVEGLALLLKAKQKQKAVFKDALDSHDKLVELLLSNKKQIEESIAGIESSRKQDEASVAKPATSDNQGGDADAQMKDSVPDTDKSPNESPNAVEEIEAMDLNDAEMQGEVGDENEKPKKQKQRKDVNKVRESGKTVKASEPGQYFSQSEEQPRKYPKRNITKTQ